MKTAPSVKLKSVSKHCLPCVLEQKLITHKPTGWALSPLKNYNLRLKARLNDSSAGRASP